MRLYNQPLRGFSIANWHYNPSMDVSNHCTIARHGLCLGASTFQPNVGTRIVLVPLPTWSRRGKMRCFHKQSGGAVVVLVLAGVAIGGCQADREELPQPSRLSDIAKPATVLIQTHFSAQVSVPEVTIPESKLKALMGVVIRRVRRG
jgi:hypothetical protein